MWILGLILFFVTRNNKPSPIEDSPYENKVRQHWLWSTALMALFDFGYLFYWSLKGAAFGYPIGIDLWVSIVSLIVWYLMAYHFTYHIRESVWLSCMIFLLSFSVLAFILSLIYEPFFEIFEQYQVAQYSFISISEIKMMIVMDLLVKGYCLICSIVLLRSYRQRRLVISEMNFQNSAESQDYVQQMQRAKSLSELNTVYGKAMYFGPQWEKHFTTIYRKQKQHVR